MDAPRVVADFETRSKKDLKTAGAHCYASHPSTVVSHFGFRFPGEAAQCWLPGPSTPFPRRLIQHVQGGGLIVFHHAGFDRRIWNIALRRMVPGLPELPIEQTSCTMARALAIGLPGSLEALAISLRLNSQKDMEGNALMKAWCKPNKEGKLPPLPKEIEQRITQYVLSDIDTGSAVDAWLPELSERERSIWILDQQINDRGIYVDLDNVGYADDLKHECVRLANAEIKALTGGHVSSVSEAQRIAEWLRRRGYNAPSASENELNQIMLDEGDEIARRVIELRTSTAKSSIAKLQRILACVGSDSRIRDQYLYHGADTARWTSRIVQVQNFPRALKRLIKHFPRLFEALERYGSDSKQVAAYITFCTGERPMELLAKGLRRFIRAAPGCKLIGADFGQIEGRFNAWVAGDDTKVEAFRASDKGLGPDVYRIGAAGFFGIPLEDVSDEQRQVGGKVPELAGGYQGSVGAFVNMAAVYGIRIADIVPIVRAVADPGIWAEYQSLYHSARDKHGLNAECWIACKIMVRSFRMRNEPIAKSWYAYQRAAIRAIEQRGEVVHVERVRNVSYMCERGFLWCCLPSGRLIGYFDPSIDVVLEESLVWANGLVEDASTYTPSDMMAIVSAGFAELVKHKPRKQISFKGMAKGALRSKKLYGGLLCNNIVQGSCRDIQAEAMLRLQSIGFSIVAHTHDEITAEIPKHFEAISLFTDAMESSLSWAPGLPIKVDPWEGDRYVK
jgi:DNA polymerase bacteriophage-type